MLKEVRLAAEKIAAARNIPLAHLLAVIEVESAGRVFGWDGRPMILPEPHLLYRQTQEPERGELVALGLASKRWNKKLYAKSQQSRWAQVERAQSICGNVAFEPVSYGVGQVLGQHWQALGYADLPAYFERVCSGIEGQLEVMMRYIVINGLEDDLREGRWPTFFRGYNGVAWEKNGYGAAIKKALRKFGGATAEPDGMLRMGSKGARVRELQALLARAGQQVKVDGDFGPSTRDALKAFQLAKGIEADGIYGPETEGALAELRQSADDRPGAQKPIEVKEVIEGVGGAGGGLVVNQTIDQAKEAVEGASGQLQQLDGLSQWVSYGLTALSIIAAALALAALGYAAWGWWKSRQTVEV